MKTKNVYTLARVQTFRSLDGGGYNADILKNGKKIAEAHDDGNGGGVLVNYDAATKYFGRGTPDADFEADAMAWYKSRPENAKYAESPHAAMFSVESFLGRLLEKHETTKRITRDMKKNVVIRPAAAKPGTWSVIKIGGQWTREKIIAGLTAKHPTDVICTPETIDAFVEALLDSIPAPVFA
jgi:hypothetical protein